MSFAEIDNKKQDDETLKPYDARNEYRHLLELVAKEDKKRTGADVAASVGIESKDIYQELMAKERRVLDTVDRVVNDAAERRLEETVFHRMPVHEIIMRTLGSMHALWDDLVTSTSAKDVWEALADKQRMPFIGLVLVTTSIVIALIYFVQ